MRFKIISILSSGGYYVWQASTVWAILIEGLTRKICVKLFDISATSLGDVFFSISFSSGRHFVLQCNHLGIFGREANEKHLCEIILNFGQQFRE